MLSYWLHFGSHLQEHVPLKLQALQAVFPEAPMNLPFAHVVHDVAALVLSTIEPPHDPQLVHTVLPVVPMYLPLAQVVHVVADDVVSVMQPFAQLLQALCLALPWYLPTAQPMHAECPAEDEILPAAQSLHTVWPVEPTYFPFAQEVHVVAALVLSVM